MSPFKNYGPNLVVGDNFISFGCMNTSNVAHVSKFLMPFYELVRKFEDQSASPHFSVDSRVPHEELLSALELSRKYTNVVNTQLDELSLIADEVISWVKND